MLTKSDLKMIWLKGKNINPLSAVLERHYLAW